MTRLVSIPQRSSFSFSEIDTWSQCRQKWYWAYSKGVQKRRDNLAPTFGSAGHEAIAAILLGQDWEEALEKWKDEKLQGQHFEEEEEWLEDIIAGVSTLMRKYLQTYPFEEFEVIAVEQEFRVKLPYIKRTLDGYWDGIVRNRETGEYMLIEHKFPTQSFRTREQIELDAQLGIYQYAAIKSGYPVTGIIYNQIMAKPLKKPKLTSTGKAMSKQDIRTDWDTYSQAVVEAGLNPADYLDMKEKLDRKVFFQRFLHVRSEAEIVNFVYDLIAKLKDMSRKENYIYMSENRMNCVSCQFRELCLAKVKGQDNSYLLETQYEQRKPRKPRQLTEEEEEPSEFEQLFGT